MAWDDPIVWILIVAVVVFLFGANKIPQFAKALGQARREFSSVTTGFTSNNYAAPQPVAPVATVSEADPLVEEAQKEGIDTTGKTRAQIASEISWKLNKK